MRKKPAARRSTIKTTPRFRFGDRHWHNGGDLEIYQYARSLQKAARTLIGTLDLESTPKTAWDACPIILLYRQAVELHLKSLVSEGSNFLKSPTDPISLYTTHSLRWLAQIVCQIIKTVGWEKEFKSDGAGSLADFSALVNELEELDPVKVAVHSGARRRDGSAPPQLQPSNVIRLGRKLDALIDLLDATADALAATWDLQAEGIVTELDFKAEDDFGPTIH
jgi:hypothetical protein